MSNPHIPLALIGLGLFTFLGIIALAAASLEKSRNESSLLEYRRDVAERFGWAGWETLQQHPKSLAAAKWITRAAATAAFAFTCWHTANAILQE